MMLNIWKTLVAILLVSTVVGFAYWPLFPQVGLRLTPVFYTALGLTTIQAGLVISGPIATIFVAAFRQVRSEQNAEAPSAFVSVAAPIAVFFANPLRILGKEGEGDDTPTDSVLAAFEAVKVLWWTYFTHLALGTVVLISNIVVLTGQQSDWIFPPVFTLIVMLPISAGFAAALHMVYSRTFADTYSEHIAPSVPNRSTPTTVLRKTFIGAFVTGWLIVPILATYYSGLTADLR